MSSLFDSLVPYRRRERRRLREEEERLSERYGDLQISAPNQGCWIGAERTPELEWSSPSLKGSFSPSTTPSIVNSSPDLNRFSDRIVIADSDEEPSGQVHAGGSDRNCITITKSLPRSPRDFLNGPNSLPQSTTNHSGSVGQGSPTATSQPPLNFKSISGDYVCAANDLSRGNSPVPSVVGTSPHVSPPPLILSSVKHASPPASLASSVRHASPPPSMVFSVRNNNAVSSLRRSPSPPLAYDDGPNISAIMLLSPVSEDFATQDRNFSTFARRSHVDSLPLPPPERPSTAMSSHSVAVMSDVGSVVSTRSFASRGPGLGATSVMRSSSQSTAVMSDVGSSVSRALPEGSVVSTMSSSSRVPRLGSTSVMRSSSRDPTNRRAMSREPTRRRAMTGESVIRRGQSCEALNQRTISSNESYEREKYGSGDAFMILPTTTYTTEPLERNASFSSSVAGSYYSSIAKEYRHIAKETSNYAAADSESLVGRSRREKVRRKKNKKKQEINDISHNHLVPSGEDLYS